MLVLDPLVVLELREVLVFQVHLRVQCTDAVDVVLSLLLLLLVHSHFVLARLLRPSVEIIWGHLNDASILQLLNLHLLVWRELATLHLEAHRRRLVVGLLLWHVATSVVLPLIIVSVSVLIILILHLGLEVGILRSEEGLALGSHSWLQIFFSVLPIEVLAWFALVRRHAEDRIRRVLHVTLTILRLLSLSVLKRII